VEHGKLRITVKPRERKPLKDYLLAQSRFRKTLSEADVEELEKKVIEKWNLLLELEKLDRIV